MKRILVANRGEIARRIIHTAHAMGLETVAVYSEADAGAQHVREAGCAFALGGQHAADSYLRIDRLLAAAQATQADAVHPGYGFLSEDPDFAQAVADAGLCWIGPPAAAIRALGSKASAKTLALAHGIPCLPGYAGADQSLARFHLEAERLGYPLMVKAVAGGGGRGMRLVQAAGELAQALHSASAEALAGFGNAALLIERALRNPRHVELQIFADQHGQCIHLGERDCSVQRRHQKIIEEAPSPALNAALRERMASCAVALAQAAGYVGAGTVEFLLEGDQFFLMEMNTRLQVEHPVTEALTGLDLVEWQIRIARGEPLPLAQAQIQWRGHAIEVRLCAEDAHFTPHSGQLLHLALPDAAQFCQPIGSPQQASLRWDHAVEVGLEVTPYYDALLGKLIVHAASREAAIDHLVQALGQTELLGLPTNRAFLAACLAHPQFRAGQAQVDFLATQADVLREEILKQEQTMHASCATAIVFSPKNYPQTLPYPFPRPLRLQHHTQLHQLLLCELGAGHWRLECRAVDAQPARTHALQLRCGGPRTVLCTLDGVTRQVRLLRLPSLPSLGQPPRWHLQSGSVDWWLDDLSHLARNTATTQAAHATELRAPFNGRVLAIHAVVGQPLAAGESAVVLESMKLEHNLASSSAASVAEVLVSCGQQVAPGQLLLRLAPIPEPSPIAKDRHADDPTR